MSTDAINPVSNVAPTQPVMADAAVASTPATQAPAQSATQQGGNPAAERLLNHLRELQQTAAEAKAQALAESQARQALEQQFAPMKPFVEAMQRMQQPQVEELDPFTEYKNMVDGQVTGAVSELEQLKQVNANFAAQSLYQSAEPAISSSGLSPGLQAEARKLVQNELRNLPLTSSDGRLSLASLTPAMVQEYVNNKVIKELKAFEQSVIAYHTAPKPAAPIYPPGQGGAVPIDTASFSGKGGVRALYAQLNKAGLSPV